MNIHVISAVGTGSTLLSSFDNVLQKAGVCNYNLIILSSIIPPGSKIVKTVRYITPPEHFGYKLYVIKAEIRSDEAGKYITAGIGWYQLDDGRGFFVEHELKGEIKEAVQSEIQARIINSLKDLCLFRDVRFEPKWIKSAVSIVHIKDSPTCALALAVYKSEGWK